MTTPIWRSLLYVPANNERFLAKATQRGADAIILDLEDSVPVDLKTEAQRKLPETIAALAGKGPDILVRVNSSLRHCVEDIAAAVRPGVAALFLPKIASEGHLELLSGYVDEVEREQGMVMGSIALVPMIESPQALLRCESIATASKRNVAMVLGGEDLATEARFLPSAETLSGPKLRVAMAAKAAGLMALGLLDSVANIGDVAESVRLAERSSRYGFDGATCVHPSMVPILNQAFSPSAESLALARRTVTVMEAAWQAGHGAARLDGRMIDMPIYQRARNLIARHEHILSRDL
ncbi:HpcH/HpaI aldolase/citrate lyase family protein [Salinicola halophyticus]|uniref:HpcH/HpaI aldolase/citrate lyase family protein n=1 Tax=Salinicola halophyticus TaxID=1808881 RepID=UPI003F451358